MSNVIIDKSLTVHNIVDGITVTIVDFDYIKKEFIPRLKEKFDNANHRYRLSEVQLEMEMCSKYPYYIVFFPSTENKYYVWIYNEDTDKLNKTWMKLFIRDAGKSTESFSLSYHYIGDN